MAGESLPRPKLAPDSAVPVRDSDRIAAQAFPLLPRLVFHIKPSDAGPFDEIRGNYGT